MLSLHRANATRTPWRPWARQTQGVGAVRKRPSSRCQASSLGREHAGSPTWEEPPRSLELATHPFSFSLAPGCLSLSLAPARTLLLPQGGSGLQLFCLCPHRRPPQGSKDASCHFPLCLPPPWTLVAVSSISPHIAAISNTLLAPRISEPPAPCWDPLSWGAQAPL